MWHWGSIMSTANLILTIIVNFPTTFVTFTSVSCQYVQTALGPIMGIFYNNASTSYTDRSNGSEWPRTIMLLEKFKTWGKY